MQVNVLGQPKLLHKMNPEADPGPGMAEVRSLMRVLFFRKEWQAWLLFTHAAAEHLVWTWLFVDD